MMGPRRWYHSGTVGTVLGMGIEVPFVSSRVLVLGLVCCGLRLILRDLESWGGLRRTGRERVLMVYIFIVMGGRSGGVVPVSSWSYFFGWEFLLRLNHFSILYNVVERVSRSSENGI